MTERDLYIIRLVLAERPDRNVGRCDFFLFRSREESKKKKGFRKKNAPPKLSTIAPPSCSLDRIIAAVRLLPRSSLHFIGYILLYIHHNSNNVHNYHLIF